MVGASLAAGACRQRRCAVLLDRERAPRRARRSRASTSAPRRSATPAAASSKASASGTRSRRRRLRSAPFMSRTPAASASRASTPPSRGSRPSATSSANRRHRGGAVGALARGPRTSRCACRRGCTTLRSAPTRCRFETVTEGAARRARGRARWWSRPTARTRRSARPPASRRRSRTTTRWRSWPTSRPIAPHEGIAYERFTAAGPLALLPLHDGSFAVIWACRAGARRAAAGAR